MKDQRGVSLVEVMVALGVASLLLGTLATVVFRFGQGFDNGNSQIAVNRRLEDAIAFVSGDANMAKYTSLVTGAAPATAMTLFWSDYFNGSLVTHTSSYSVVAGNLQRTYDGVASTAGKSVTDATFSLKGQVITVTLTVTATEGGVQRTEVKSYRLVFRPVN